MIDELWFVYSDSRMAHPRGHPLADGLRAVTTPTPRLKFLFPKDLDRPSSMCYTPFMRDLMVNITYEGGRLDGTTRAVIECGVLPVGYRRSDPSRLTTAIYDPLHDKQGINAQRKEFNADLQSI